MEEANENEGLNISIRSTTLYRDNEKLFEERNITLKSKDEAGAKVKQLLKFKKNLIEFHQKSKTKLAR